MFISRQLFNHQSAPAQDRSTAGQCERAPAGPSARRTRPIARIITLVVMTGLLLGALAHPALAQSGGGLGGALDGVVTAIVDIVQSVTIGLGILGLTIWGLARVARPIFPEINQRVQGYIPNLLIGMAVIFVATEIVEAVAGAIGV